MVHIAFDKLIFEIFLRCNVFGSKLDFANVFYIYFGSFGYFGVAAPICEKGHRIAKAENNFWTKDKRPGEKLGGTSL